MQKAILVDIDGTLADVNHRVHHVQAQTKDWKAFNEGMVHDELNLWCRDLILAMKDKGYKTVFITGRGESYRTETLEWMKKHKIEVDELFMRPKSDRREDSDVKKEIYVDQIKDKYEVLFVVEDRASVVKMWREIGLVCLQCDVGDF